MVFFSDGYSVKGKFGTNTGASSTPKSKKKYGYKGKKKTAPKQTKNYGFNDAVDMSSGGDDDRPTADEKEAFRATEAPAAETYIYKWGTPPGIYENNSHIPKGKLIKGIQF